MKAGNPLPPSTLPKGYVPPTGWANRYLAHPTAKYPFTDTKPWASQCSARGIMRPIAVAKVGVSTSAVTIFGGRVGYDGGGT